MLCGPGPQSAARYRKEKKGVGGRVGKWLSTEFGRPRDEGANGGG